MKHTFVFIALFIAIALTFSGCAETVSSIPPEQVSETVSPYEPQETPAIMPKPTPIRTTEPEPTQTPAPSKTPKPTEKSTPKPTQQEKGKTIIAEGFYYVELSDKLKERITGMSYPEDDEDCQVTYKDLRYIKLLHYDFEGNVKEGELIVNKKVAKEVTQIFYELYKNKYPLTSVRLVDDFKQPGHDTASMEANNSSAFCYRRVNDSKNMSHHSFGGAIDINPMFNPYVNGDKVSPKNSKPYLDRTKDFEGKIDHNDLCYKLFKKYGWKWGGDFSDPDYQHFYKDLGYDRRKP